MTNPAELLGIAPDADLAAIKAAYRAKLKEFPAHSHPTEFKAVRQAYDALRQAAEQEGSEDEPLLPKPLEVEVDSELVQALRQSVLGDVEKPLEAVIKLSF